MKISSVWAAIILFSYSMGVAAADPGNALLFDGQDDIALVPENAALHFAPEDSASFELWVKLTSDQALWHALGKRSGCGGTMNYQLAQDVSHLLHFNTSGCVFPIGIDVPVNEWTHLAVTADSSVIRFYVNAAEVGQTNCSLGPDNPAPVIIGGSGDCPYKFPGLIDEVRIWSAARTAQQIKANYNCAVSETSTDLLAYWKFDEETDAQAILDSSPSGFHGSRGAGPDPGTDDPVRVESDAPIDCVVFQDGFENTLQAEISFPDS